MGSDFAEGTQETLQECAAKLVASTIADRVALRAERRSRRRAGNHSVESEDQQALFRRGSSKAADASKVLRAGVPYLPFFPS